MGWSKDPIVSESGYAAYWGRDIELKKIYASYLDRFH
jgi:hypothetical protein